MTEEPQADFKPTRSNLIDEIKGQLMNLNDAVSKARAAQRFQPSTKPSSAHVYMAAYEQFDRLFGLSRELLSTKLTAHAEEWLDTADPFARGTSKFMDDLTTYKRMLDTELYDIGIKDTNLRQPVVYPMKFHADEYGHLDPSTPDVEDEADCVFSVRGTEAMG